MASSRSLVLKSGVFLILCGFLKTATRDFESLMASSSRRKANAVDFKGKEEVNEYHEIKGEEEIYEEYIPAKIPFNAVDITFTHSDPMEAHNPNFGARDENGNDGYVPDVTNLRKNPPVFSLNGTRLTEACGFHDEWGDWEAIQNRIRLVDPTMAHTPRSKILCIVYSVEPSHKKKIPVLLETWGSRCDGFMVASNKTDPNLHTVDIPHQGPEFYGNMWQKVRSIWGYVYDNFFEDYDWFHMGGDDMWVIVENLRYYLDSPEIRRAAYGGHSNMQVPLYLGTTFAQEGRLDSLFQTGGPGYTLNKAALKQLVLKGLLVHHVSMWKSMEDLKIAEAFRRLNIAPFRTATKEGSVRYNHFPPGRHYRGLEPHFYKVTYTKGLNYTRGKDHSAEHSVSFHYIQSDQMRRLHALLYGLCSNGNGIETTTIKHPQLPRLGRFSGESAHPYLSTDIWNELVDNNRTFFLRPKFTGEFQSERGWMSWLDNLPWPVKLVMNNNFDWPWPDEKMSITPNVLEHPKLERLYVINPNVIHPKLTPLPLGLKWQFRSTDLYGEKKEGILALLHTVSKSPNETQRLFLNPRPPSVWVRPATNRHDFLYDRTNDALRTPRNQLCGILEKSAPRTAVCPKDKISSEEYFSQLKMHRFVASPPGHGLDTHCTWEALLAGCIPIVPRSTLDPMFKGLPVWLIDSWEEVTDESVVAKAKEMQAATDDFVWDKIFAMGWKEELQS